MRHCLFFLLGRLLSLVSANTFSNPLKPHDGADPAMVYVSGTPGYYYLVTTGSPGRLEMTRSQTLEGLKHGETKMIWDATKQPESHDYWAPEVHLVNGTWYMYYTAAWQKDGTIHKPFVARGGKTPWDDYFFLAQLSDDSGIDGSLITFPTYGQFFIWSCWGRPVAAGKAKTIGEQQICIAPLLSPGKIGERSVISRPQLPWEKVGSGGGVALVNEGPHALYHESGIFVTYSASLCSTGNYSLGLLTWKGGDPTHINSWDKSPEPVLKSANGNFGTGHNGQVNVSFFYCQGPKTDDDFRFFQSPDDTEIWNVFHAQDKVPGSNGKGGCSGIRYTMAERVYFSAKDANGRPSFEQAQKLSEVQQAPSGECKEKSSKDYP